jgi:hypothetical protein
MSGDLEQLAIEAFVYGYPLVEQAHALGDTSTTIKPSSRDGSLPRASSISRTRKTRFTSSSTQLSCTAVQQIALVARVVPLRP